MTAPTFNSFNALNGEVAEPPQNTKFWDANADADANLAELERLHDVESDYGELRVRCDELFHENAELRVKVRRLETRLARAESERDEARAGVVVTR